MLGINPKEIHQNLCATECSTEDPKSKGNLMPNIWWWINEMYIHTTGGHFATKWAHGTNCTLGCSSEVECSPSVAEFKPQHHQERTKDAVTTSRRSELYFCIVLFMSVNCLKQTESRYNWTGTFKGSGDGEWDLGLRQFKKCWGWSNANYWPSRSG